MAEVLWSDPITGWEEAEHRFLVHRERLIELGVNADAVEPEWCMQNEENCRLDAKFNNLNLMSKFFNKFLKNFWSFVLEYFCTLDISPLEKRSTFYIKMVHFVGMYLRDGGDLPRWRIFFWTVEPWPIEAVRQRTQVRHSPTKKIERLKI